MSSWPPGWSGALANAGTRPLEPAPAHQAERCLALAHDTPVAAGSEAGQKHVSGVDQGIGALERLLASDLPALSLEHHLRFISAHRVFVVETVHPVEVAASQQAHLVQWLSRRVGHALKVPDLSARGFELMGGRVIPEAGMAAAQFMYQDGEGHRLTLLVRTGGAAEAGFRFVQADGVSAFSWDDDGLSYAIVAGVDRAKLLSLAEATYRQLDPGQSVPPTRD